MCAAFVRAYFRYRSILKRVSSDAGEQQWRFGHTRCFESTSRNVGGYLRERIMLCGK